MRKNKLLLASLVFTGLHSYAQSTHHFTEGLLISSGSRYGREAIYTDVLAWKLYNNNISKPTEGAILDITDKGDTLSWQPIKADSANRFLTRRWQALARGNTFGNPNRVDRGTGYIYFTYNSSKEQPAILNVKGNSGIYFNGVPHMGDPYSSGYMYVPVKLKKGLNELYVRGTNITADLIFNDKPVLLSTDDLTLPTIVTGQPNSNMQGAIVVINTSAKELKNVQFKTSLGGKELTTAVPAIPAMSTRKVRFDFDGSSVTAKGWNNCLVTLLNQQKVADTATIKIESTEPSDKYAVTFTSNIDGSLQYYAVTPQLPAGNSSGNALFLSVHGAGVEALGQARAYQSKDWGTLVAATNRRPRGFNWEDWGRLDALEVLSLAKAKFQPHPQHIYLTGHSMGGHGTWFLGATYPDKWAAIAPCAGYPTLKGYGSADGVIPDSSNSVTEQMLLRSSNQSDVPRLATNYKQLGVYVLHGDADRVVPVTYARQMRKALADFHGDYSYYEYPGGEHWFGNESVDWKYIFDYFKWHKLAVDTAVNTIDFMTASPGISASYRWASILQQQHPLEYSRIQLKRNNSAKSITGSADNVKLLQFNLKEFGSNAAVKITLDSQALQYNTNSANDSIILKKENDKWSIADAPTPQQKNPTRYGTFKDAFNYNMIFVYGTAGTKEENEWSYNKAVYDAETWYYRGNGAVDIVSDKVFVAGQYKDRGVILFGNAETNSAWQQLLANCPIQVKRNSINAGEKTFTGDDLGAYFVWPLTNSGFTSVGVVAGTGLKGMNAANANQYFAGASGFPDFMIYSLDMLKKGSSEIKLAGFFDSDWKLSTTDMAEGK
ncbi:alpha/beta hydrolase-fold protein [Foetidibacter luteolus]|uniref:carboxylesterase family protein n=1 Tax=Foetidibacter luteolus TaxID=2608880 RepID=UPI00129A4D20|nr:alpha/beta hydrolase-fold protein [Foetidibacter luteolus]